MSQNNELQKITLHEALDMIETAITSVELGDAPANFMFYSKIGVGKTTSIQELCERKGIGFRSLQLSNKQIEDINGIPHFVEAKINGEIKKTVEFVSLHCLPSESDPDFKEIGVLFMDEITTCPEAVHTAALSLLDSTRTINDYTLPKKWIVVCAGNGKEDGGVNYTELSAALHNRPGYSMGGVFKIEPTADEWLEWGAKAGVHPTVYGYLTEYKDKIHDYNTETESETEEGGVYCTPRTWTSLSNTIFGLEKIFEYNRKNAPYKNIIGNYTEEESFNRKLEMFGAGQIGVGNMKHFMTFYKFGKDCIPVAQILENSGAKQHNGDISNISTEAFRITISKLIIEINRLAKGVMEENKNIEKEITNLYTWLGKLHGKDDGIITNNIIALNQSICGCKVNKDLRVSDFTTTEVFRKENQNWDAWVKENQAILNF